VFNRITDKQISMFWFTVEVLGTASMTITCLIALIITLLK